MAGWYDASMKWNVPHIHPSRLRTAPGLRPIERGEGRTTFAVDGLVCGLCAARTRTALAGVEGVCSVDVDLDRGIAEVEHEGALPGPAALQSALDRAVVALPVRKLIDRLTHRRVRRRGHEAA